MNKLLFLPLALALFGCADIWEDLPPDAQGNARTGWLADDEDFSPQDLSPFGGDSSGLPAAASLESRFPPVGDQGQYGTCIVWAVGYNLKTALNSIEKNWSAADLEKAANQTSPKDLWMAIPPGKKGAKCEGTTFKPALDALVSKGAASMFSAPYANLGDCSGSSGGNAGNKLAGYQQIAYNNSLRGGTKKDGMSLANFKGYIAQGRPVLIGARLGERFKRWSSRSAISSDEYNDPDAKHSFHAMVVSGYDDSKNAFRVRNSWGASWGDGGSIWVDYDFFLEEFCFAAYVARN